MKLILGDCLEKLKTLEANSVDSIVSDPPYGIAFMGARWDYDVPSVEIWQECLRVLKPGGHLLAFAGTRTQHRMCVRIEDAGFEIRDMLAWLYGTGFPKSLDVGKDIDEAAGAKREVVGEKRCGLSEGSGDTVGKFTDNRNENGKVDITAPATEEAKKWDGWHTALKPALEPITMARKPLGQSVYKNVLEFGTGAINVNDCRIASSEVLIPFAPKSEYDIPKGRWPANVLHDGSDEAKSVFPDGASRFFYSSKVNTRERNEGLAGLAEPTYDAKLEEEAFNTPRVHNYKNSHPTVKPQALMSYLCRLVTPKGGTVLDPFMGSGSTGVAAINEWFDFVGIEREPKYFEIATQRIAHAQKQLKQLRLF